MYSAAHIDLETRSVVDLRKAGSHAYFEHPTTDINCAAFAFDDEPVELWTPGEPCPEALAEHIRAGGVLIAFNAAFESLAFEHVLGPRYGWPVPALTQWRCAMVKAMAMSLPAALADVPGALGLAIEKDSAGGRVMMQLAKPRSKDPLVWWEDSEKHEKLRAYCVQDVQTERAADKRLLNLIPREQELWVLDQRVNRRGVFVDVELCEQAKKIVAAATDRLNAEIAKVSGFEINGCTNVNQITTYLRRKGLEVESIAKAELDELLARDDLAPDVRRVVEIRREAAMASVAKIDALLRGRSADGRAKGLLQFHAASTGRWGGRRFQPQNLRRPDPDHEENMDDLVAAVRTGSIDYVEAMYGAPLTAVADCLRGMIAAPAGRKIIAADYSNIEGRVLAWLAGEHWKVEAFLAYDRGEGPDIYKATAGGILGKKPEDVSKDERQGQGKVPELACGFQGSVGAFQSMAAVYRYKVTDERAKSIVDAWRARHPMTKELWYEMERSAIEAVEDPGETVYAANGRIAFKKVGSFLFMRLPSGRALIYPYPHFDWKTMPWKDDSGKHPRKLCLAYKGVDSRTRKWGQIFTYGGSLVENAVQAIARDIMADAMPRIEAAGYPIILTVHDEVVAEVPDGHGSVSEFTDIMTDLPAWADGCPIAADGWMEERYRK